MGILNRLSAGSEVLRKREHDKFTQGITDTECRVTTYPSPHIQIYYKFKIATQIQRAGLFIFARADPSHAPPKDARPLATHLIMPAVPALLQPRCLIFYPHGSQAKPEWSLISRQRRDLPLAFYQLLLKGTVGRRELFLLPSAPPFKATDSLLVIAILKNTAFSIANGKAATVPGLPGEGDSQGLPPARGWPRFGPTTGTRALGSRHPPLPHATFQQQNRGFRRRTGGKVLEKAGFCSL